MKILVTGGAGFIGSHIVDAYIDKGYDVVIVDNLTTGKVQNINPKAKFYKVDITEYDKIKEIIETEKPEIINHHAAQIDVRKSVADPTYDAQVNIVGSLNLLDIFVKFWFTHDSVLKNKKFIFASSGGTIYGECSTDIPPDETFPAKPESPYGCAKLAIEYYLGYYNTVYGLSVVSLRYSNVYGPRQDPFGEAGVVAIFANAMLNKNEVYIYGDGEQTRDFVYVKDVVEANLLSTENDNFTGQVILNIGTGELTSVNELFYKMQKITGYSSSPIYKPPRKGELFKSYLNSSLAKKLLNWGPKTSLDTGLKKTVEYFSNFCNS